MLIPHSEEVIARFIGMFGMLDFDPRLHSPVTGADPHPLGAEPAASEAMTWGGLAGSYDPRAANPQLRYANDVFEIEKVRSHPVPAHDLKVDAAHLAHAAHTVPTTHSAFPEAHHFPAEAGHHAAGPIVPTTVYESEGTESLLARYNQANLLDDRDVLTMDGDADPLAVVDAVTRQFQAMVKLGHALSMVPGIPANVAELEARLTIANDPASENPAAPTVRTSTGDNWSATEVSLAAMHTPGAPIATPLELQGIYVDGAPSAAGPNLNALIANFHAAQEAEVAGASLDTGANSLATNAMIRNIGDLGFVTTVMGNWYETNAIRQFNLHSDIDDVSGLANGRLATGGTQAMNVAEFQRIDATPQNGFALPDFGFLPSNYHVDVVEGDLQITSFLSQLNFTLDGDRITLTARQHSLTLSTGGNEATASADLLKKLGSYDLVVIGGSVFEGNIIQQINILADNDRLMSTMTGPDAGGLSGSTGGNFLLNAARITNVGGLADFAPLTADMSKLVSTIARGGTIDDPGMAKDLGFLGHADVRVLYLTGNVYEMNVVSQMNVLDDNDTILQTNGAAKNFVASVGPDADWTVSTGRNALVNAATITDVDDAGFKRFMDGQYYSSSMLVQADLMARSQDVISFDPNKLASELVAFVHDDPPGHAHLHDAIHSGLHHDAPTDGIGAMLS